MKKKILPYLLLAPMILIMGVLVFYPIITTFAYSLKRWKLTEPGNIHYIGFKNYIDMRTSQFNPQIAINALMGYLGTYNYYYSWYNFIHNTYDNNFTGYVPIPGKENPFIALEEYLREPKPEILVYYNTDEEYFTFNRLQDEPMADTSMADDTFTYEEATFYIFKD